MISVCDKNVTKVEVSRVQVQRPDHAGRIWKGIAHGVLVNAIEAAIARKGWIVSNSAFSLSKDKADLVGAFDLTIPGLDAPDGVGFALGFMTSNAMRRSLRLYVGSRIFVCNNGCVTGELILRHKHTNHFRIENNIDHAMSLYRNRIEDTRDMIDGWKKSGLELNMSNSILMAAGRRGIMPFSRIGQVDSEYWKPSYAEHNEKTSWGLLNAFTHIVKKSPTHMQMDQMNRFRELLPCTQ